MADTVHIATEHIEVAPGVRAFSKGETVPASVVERLKIQDKVASARTKVAAEAIADTAPDVSPSVNPTNRV